MLCVFNTWNADSSSFDKQADDVAMKEMMNCSNSVLQKSIHNTNQQGTGH
jgi:hypothetical protein